MSVHDSAAAPIAQVPQERIDAPLLAATLRERISTFVAPLLSDLDQQIDSRLVRTFASALEVIIRFRHCSYGLLIWEMGAYLLSPRQAPAGTKRLSNLLPCAQCSSDVFASFVWREAEDQFEEWHEEREEAYVVCGHSVVGQPYTLI